MARKKTPTEAPPEVLPPMSVTSIEDLSDLLEDMAVDSTEAMIAAMHFERVLLKVAHDVAGQAIRVGEPETEAERIKAAERQVRLIGKLYAQLQAVTQPSRS